MDKLLPMYGQSFKVICTVTVSPSEEATLFSRPLQMMNSKMECQIKDWQTCQHLNTSDSRDDAAESLFEHFHCGCSSRVVENGSVHYCFFLYLKLVTAEFDSQVFKCSLGDVGQVTGTMHVISFTHQPDSIMYACVGDSVLFNWDFTPRKDLRPVLVKWYECDHEHRWLLIGTAYLSSGGRITFSNNGNPQSSLAKSSGQFPQLRLRDVKKYNEMKVKIQVTFRESRRRSRSPQQRPGVDRIPESYLEGSTFLTVKRPPSTKFFLTIRSYFSISKALIVDCRVINLRDTGEPPANLTIWVDNAILTSLPKTSRVRYKTEPDPNRYMASRSNVSPQRIRESTKFSWTHQWFIDPFYLEILASGFLLLWTISLLVKHIQLQFKIRQADKKVVFAYNFAPVMLTTTDVSGSKLGQTQQQGDKNKDQVPAPGVVQEEDKMAPLTTKKHMVFTEGSTSRARGRDANDKEKKRKKSKRKSPDNVEMETVSPENGEGVITEATITL